MAEHPPGGDDIRSDDVRDDNFRGDDIRGDDVRGASMTTGSLARRLGVSPMTLRSWDRRYGLGPAARAQGHHRRWSPQDVAMVQEMCGLTAAGVPPAEAARMAREHAARPGTTGRTRPDGDGEADTTGPAEEAGSGEEPRTRPPGDRGAPDDRESPRDRESPGGRESSRAGDGRGLGGAGRGSGGAGSGLPLGRVRRECRGLARAAIRMDSAAVQDGLTQAVGAYGLVTAWEEILTPALRAVGRKWESDGEQYVEVEHLLSWHISATLHHCYVRASQHASGDGALPVLLSCLPGEQHTLPLEALSAALAEQGLPVVMLGGAVPAEALVASVRRIGCAAVGLWSQSRSTASVALARHIAATRWGVRGARTHTPVLLCGPGWGFSADSAADMPRPRTLHEAVTTLTDPVRAGRGFRSPVVRPGP